MRRNRRVPKLIFQLSVFWLVLLSSEPSAQNSTAVSSAEQKSKDQILELSESPVVQSTNITVSWNIQNTDNYAYDYKSYLTLSSGKVIRERIVKANEHKSVTFVLLEPCTEYNITIIALYKNELYTELRDTKIYNTTSDPPPAVTKLGTTTNAAETISLTWKRPATACEITAYNITYSGVAKWGPHTEHTGSATIGRADANGARSVVIDGAQPYTDYTVAVAAATEAGGGERAFINITTLQGVPSLPTKLDANRISPTTITAWWREPQKHNGVLSDYKISWFNDGQMENSSVINEHHFTITSLLPCVKYSVMVEASTAAGNGEGATINKTTITEAPYLSCSPNVHTQTLLVKWTKPNTSCTITNYVVTWPNDTVTVDSSALQHTVTVDSSTLQHTVTVDSSALQHTVTVDSSTPQHTINNIAGQEISKVCVAAVVAEERGKWTCCGQARRRFDEETEAEDKNTTGIVVGVVAAVVVVAVLVIVAIFKKDVLQIHLCSNHNEKESAPTPDQRRRSSYPLIGRAEDDRAVTRRSWSSIAPSDVTMPEQTPEEIGLTEDTSGMMCADNLLYSVYSVVEEYYSDLKTKVEYQLEALRNPATVAAEFELINKESYVGETSAGELPINMRKNRYKNIIPFDTNRVRLRNAPGNTTDYINASYVQSSVAEDVGFIACQSPTSNTVSDFWWMVWEQNIRIIVMLVRSNEGEMQTKCTQYWPVLCEQTFASLVLKTETKETTMDGVIKRNMLLRNGRETRALWHFQFTSWPDSGVPTSEDDLLMLVKEIREHVHPDMRNIIVHCSAGVGRTGTLIALWQLQVQAERRMPGVNVRQTVLELRRHREMIVQNPEQYHFLHSCFLKYLQDMGRWKPTLGDPHFSEMSRLTMDTAV